MYREMLDELSWTADYSRTILISAYYCSAAWINKQLSVTATNRQFYVSAALMIFDKQSSVRRIEVAL